MLARPKIRLFVPEPFGPGLSLHIAAGQSHYLAHVMRAKEGDSIAVFNGQDGEWLAEVSMVGKKAVTLSLVSQLAAQKTTPDVWLAFAPIRNKTELVVEKATELGVSKLLPVFTHHAVVKSVNMEKLKAHAIEAAEQCQRHDVPQITEHKDLSVLLGAWPKDRILLFADESGHGENLHTLLHTLLPTLLPGKFGLLIGPEGGFSADEHHMLRIVAQVKAFGMGPRILRADTAATAALACILSQVGDWDARPNFT